MSLPFSSRYVETAVELQAGQTFAIAGLLQSRTEAVSQSHTILWRTTLHRRSFSTDHRSQEMTSNC